VGGVVMASEKLAVIVTASPLTKVEEAFDESSTVGPSESTETSILKVRLFVPVYAFPLVSVPETVAVT
jgi:hypothetical protein